MKFPREQPASPQRAVTAPFRGDCEIQSKVEITVKIIKSVKNKRIDWDLASIRVVIKLNASDNRHTTII